ncbi:MAG: nucleoside triphosphate pyrophosphohydrolase [Gemmatimonadetes bacterium]|nr:nucleoside triphosphate pyrophosphohydrolase [Gemmatimonadota bacterium]
MPADTPDNTVPTESPTPERPASGDPLAAGTSQAAASSLDRALDLVRFLRANCEWDAAQTPESLLPYLLEEAHETADAVAAGDDAALRAELGDLLLNVAFQVVLAEERSAFSAEDVVTTLEAKMRRRHPHIYGDGPRVEWEMLKAQERSDSNGEKSDGAVSLLHGIASGMEPLSRAQRIQERVATVGFDWPDAGGALAKVREEIEEVSELLDRPGTDDLEEEIGDLLFAVVNLARLSGVHAMRSMVRANAKFSARFAALEEMAHARGVRLGTATLEELDVLWDEVKRR